MLRHDPGHWDARYNLERAQRLVPDPEESEVPVAGPSERQRRTRRDDDARLLAGPAMKWPCSLRRWRLLATFARPTWTTERPRFEHVVVLDVTQSMNVQDEVFEGRPVSRLDAAKGALRQAVEALPCGSKIGWAIFTEYRSYLLFTPVEVCAHRAELRGALERIDSRMAWSGNSEVAKGLHSAIGIARQLPGTPSLVFVTDGHEAPPLDPNQRPPFDDKPGEVAGVIVGVGALEAVADSEERCAGPAARFLERRRRAADQPAPAAIATSTAAMKCPLPRSAPRSAANTCRRCARAICVCSPTKTAWRLRACAARSCATRCMHRRCRGR